MKKFDEQQLVFLLSMPRSGSTLLNLMLGSHPDISAPPEPWIVLAVADFFGLGNLRDLPYERKWAQIAAIEFLLRPERVKSGALADLLSQFSRSEAISPFEKTKKFLDLAYASQLDGRGETLLVDKTPRYYVGLNLIDSLYPRAKRLLLLRNPLDIFASYKAAWGFSRDIFTPEGLAVQCRDFVEGLFAFDEYSRLHPDSCEVVRYEELCADPGNTLRRICRGLGIEFSKEMLRFNENTELLEEYRRSPVGDFVVVSRPEPANPRTANAWEKRLEIDDITALVGVLGGGIFLRLGYPSTVSRLNELGVCIPTEEEALERRTSLRVALSRLGNEGPYSSWDTFLENLNSKNSYIIELADKVNELTSKQVRDEHAISVQRDEGERLRKSLDDCEIDRENRLDVILRQQVDLDRLGTELQKALLDSKDQHLTIESLCNSLAQSAIQLKESEADRAARLCVIESQQNDLNRLGSELSAAKNELSMSIERIESLSAELAQAVSALHSCRVEIDRLRETKKDQERMLRALTERLDNSNEQERTATAKVAELESSLAEMMTLRGYIRARQRRNIS